MVITDVNQVVYQGNGSNTSFPYSFRIIDDTDIKLLLIDEDGTETNITSDFFVDTENSTVYYPGYAPGEEPPLADRPPKVQTGQRLVVYRELPITQEKNLGDKWPFYVIELALDKLTMILQQIFGWWGRALKISVGQGAEGADTEVPLEAGKVIIGNADGDGFEAGEALMYADGVWDAKHDAPITNVGEPTNDSDAATKYYVDHQYDGSNVIMKDEDGEHWIDQGIPFKDFIQVGDVPGDNLVLSSNAGNGAFVEAYDEDDTLGARLALRHNDNPTVPGQFELDARKTENGVVTEAKLIGTPDGSLKWNREEVLKGNDVYYYFNPQSETFLNPGAGNNIVGECNIIKVGGKVIMIDTGGDNRSASIKTYLQGLGITKVDYLIISHWHYDHFTNVENMGSYIDWSDCVAYLPILPTHNDVLDYAWIHVNAPSTIAYISNNFKEYIYPTSGTVLQVADNFKLTFYNCGSAAETAIYNAQAAEVLAHVTSYDYYYNDYSMVVKVDHNNVSIVYSGDIMKVAQQVLFDSKAYSNIDVYKMHHHGVNGYMSDDYCNSLHPLITTCQVAQSVSDNYFDSKLVSSDLQLFLNSRLLMPYLYNLVLKSDGHKFTIVDGREEYTQQDKAFIQLSANANRIMLPADFDDYEQGTYTIMSGSDVLSMTHCPSDYTGGNARLICMKNASTASATGGYIVQFLIPCNPTERIYVRSYIDSSVSPHWTGWVQIPVMFSNGINRNQDAVSGETDNLWVRFNGGTDYGKGGSIILYGKDQSTTPGRITLNANNGSADVSLILNPSGIITWGGKTVIVGNTYTQTFSNVSVNANANKLAGTLSYNPTYYSVKIGGSGYADVSAIVNNSNGNVYIRNMGGSNLTGLTVEVNYIV